MCPACGGIRLWLSCAADAIDGNPATTITATPELPAHAQNVRIELPFIALPPGREMEFALPHPRVIVSACIPIATNICHDFRSVEASPLTGWYSSRRSTKRRITCA